MQFNMSKPQTELYLPGSYAEQLTDRDRMVHEVWQQSSLRTIEDWMPKDGTFTELADGRTIGHVELNPEGLSRDEAVALLFPFGNGYGPSMAIRTGIMRDMLDEPLPVLMYPNNTIGQDWYDLYDEIPADVSLAESIVESAAKNGVKKLHVITYSQGATIGGRMLHLMENNFDIEDTGVMLGDAPNVVMGRTSKQIGKDFKAGGIKTLNKAINDSAIPALSEAQHARGGLDGIRQLAGFAMFGLGATSFNNKRLRASMAFDGFATDIVTAQQGPNNLLIVRMEDSLICTDELDAALEQTDHEVEVVPGYGHEGGDNIVLHALLARKAIRRATAA